MNSPPPNIERAMEDLDEPLTDGLVRTSEKIYDAPAFGEKLSGDGRGGARRSALI